MIFIGKYLFAMVSLAGVTVFNIYLLISNISNRKSQREQVDEINSFAKAVEKVDDMDDDDLIATLGGMRSKTPTMCDGDKNANDK